jgi:hypothetical protein
VAVWEIAVFALDFSRPPHRQGAGGILPEGLKWTLVQGVFQRIEPAESSQAAEPLQNRTIIYRVWIVDLVH